MRTSIYKCLTVVLSAVLLLASCEKEIKYIGEYDGEKIVLNGILSTDDPEIRVMLTRSQFVFIKDPNNVRENFLRGADVTVDVNGTSMKLIEDKTLDHDGEYFCDYQVKEGDVVSIKVHYEGLKDASATTVVPDAPKATLKSVVVSTPERDYMKQIDFKVTIHDDAAQENYYKMFCSAQYSEDFVIEMACASDDPIFVESPDIFEMFDDWMDQDPDDKWHDLNYAFDDGKFSGESHDFNIKGSIYNWNIPYDDNEIWEEFGEYSDLYDSFYDFFNDKMKDWNPDPSMFTVNVLALSDDFYKYRKSFMAYTGSDGIFSEPVSIHSNIKGGIGIFASVSRTQLRQSKESVNN